MKNLTCPICSATLMERSYLDNNYIEAISCYCIMRHYSLYFDSNDKQIEYSIKFDNKIHINSSLELNKTNISIDDHFHFRKLDYYIPYEHCDGDLFKAFEEKINRYLILL